MGRFGRVALPGFLVALFAFALPAFAAIVTVNGTTSFSSLDGSVDDHDYVVNGIFTVNGDLIVIGTINCNDTGPGNASACPMQFVVSGNLLLASGSHQSCADTLDAGDTNVVSPTASFAQSANGTLCQAAGDQPHNNISR